MGGLGGADGMKGLLEQVLGGDHAEIIAIRDA